MSFILIPRGKLIASRPHYTNGLQKKRRKKNWLAETRRERGGEGEAEGKERENIFLLCEPTYT